MSGPVAARAAASGPLNSVMGQWAILGLGAYVVAGPEKAGELFRDGLRFFLRLAGDLSEPTAGRQASGPIVIHSTPAAPNATGVGGVLRLILGASMCWGSYMFLTSMPWIPDSVKSVLPITRSLFERAVTSLAKSITSVRDSLAAQISSLGSQQDELSAKQDETHSEVLAARSDLYDLRFDVDDVRSSLERCESSLGRAEGRTSYAARGVRLLVRCVRAVMPANAPLAVELDEFGRTNPEDGEDAKGDITGREPGQERQLEDEEGARRGAPPAQARSQQDWGQQSPTTSLARPPRRLERMDSVPERTENERPESQAPPPTRDIDGLDDVRALLLNPDRLSFRQ